MRYVPAFAASLIMVLALGGCDDGKAVDAKNESPQGVAKKVADAGIRLEPGHWESTMQFVRMDIKGMPPEAQQAMQQMMGKGRSFASCLTREEAEKPEGKFFGQQENDCRYDSFTMGGGKIDAKMTCKNEGHDTVMTMAGTYSPRSYDMQVSMTGKAPNGQQMDMGMALTSKRTGECTGKEDS